MLSNTFQMTQLLWWTGMFAIFWFSVYCEHLETNWSLPLKLLVTKAMEGDFQCSTIFVYLLFFYNQFHTCDCQKDPAAIWQPVTEHTFSPSNCLHESRLWATTLSRSENNIVNPAAVPILRQVTKIKRCATVWSESKQCSAVQQGRKTN